MGLSKGHTFTDGETVTAAKLNNLVDNATITSDTVTTAMIQDNAVTADKLATDAVTGANIASNSINLTSLSNASGGTSGTIVQSGAGGVFEEFTPGTSGTFLKSAGTDASLTWGTVDATGVDATMISGHTEITSPGTDDVILVKDKAAGVNKSLQIQNLYKTVSGLTALSSADIANPDEFLVLDGGIPKKITKANLGTATLTSVNDLTALTSSTVADDDVMLVYDTSASAVKKIAKVDLSTGQVFARGKFSLSNINSSSRSVAFSESRNIASASIAYGGATNTVDLTISFSSTASSVPTPTFSTYRNTATSLPTVEILSVSTTQCVIRVVASTDAVGSQDDPDVYLAFLL